MSLILEALRKSEAERRRGTTPDVAMELPPTALPRARANPAWLLPAVLFAVVALLAAWWWSQRTVGPPASNEPQATGPSTEPSIDIAPPPLVVTRRAPAPSTAPAPLPVASTPRPPANTVEAAVPFPMPAPVQPQPMPMPPPAPADTNGVANIGATSLPPVKLSMHIWDASPGQRFVILDGRRMGEGDRNGEVTVVAIERDGVVVERNGRRARVPLP